MGERWTPKSWRHLPIEQVPAYPDAAALGAVESQIASFRRWSLQVRPAS